MALDTLPPRRTDTTAGTDAPQQVRRTGLSRDRDDDRRGLPPRSLLVALVLACLTLMVVDKAGGEDSPLDPARRLVGEVFGPAEAAADAVFGPFAAVPGAFRTNETLREEVARLEAENARLRGELRREGYTEARRAEFAALREVAGDLGYALKPARVIGIGPAQSFSATVTIDAGSEEGVRPDMTVLNGDGLVGRITSVTSQTATVLLVVDAQSTVGGRVGPSLEMGVVEGRGAIGDGGRLDLELVDRTVVPEPGQVVVTRGSEGGAPYVSGVPIGEVTKVFESVREGSYRTEIRPYVDFTALDLVGVVVPSGGNGRVIEADGSLR